jgi:pimeloyl-ACP methyl ester carboxylesterase
MIDLYMQKKLTLGALVSCIKAYQKTIAGAQVAEIAGVGHRPEIENSAEFVHIVNAFLAA